MTMWKRVMSFTLALVMLLSLAVSTLPTAFSAELSVPPGWELAEGLEGKFYQLITMERGGSQAAVCATLSRSNLDSNRPMLGGCRVKESNGVYTPFSPEDYGEGVDAKTAENFISRWCFEPAGEPGKYYLRADTGKYACYNKDNAIRLEDEHGDAVCTVYTNGSEYVLLQKRSIDEQPQAMNQNGGAGYFRFAGYSGNNFGDLGNRFYLVDQNNGYAAATELTGACCYISSGTNSGYLNESSETVVASGAVAVTPWSFAAVDAAKGAYYVKTLDGRCIDFRRGQISLAETEVVTTVYGKDNTYVMTQWGSDGLKVLQLNGGFSGAYSPNSDIFNDGSFAFSLTDALNGYRLADAASLKDNGYQLYNAGSDGSLLGLERDNASDPTKLSGISVKRIPDVYGSSIIERDPTDGSARAMHHWFFEEGEKPGEYYLRTYEGEYIYRNNDGSTVSMTRNKTAAEPITVYEKNGKYVFAFPGSSFSVLHRNGTQWTYTAAAPFDDINNEISMIFRYRPAEDLEGGYQIYAPTRADLPAIAFLDTTTTTDNGKRSMFNGTPVKVNNDGTLTAYHAKMENERATELTEEDPDTIIPTFYFESTGETGKYYLRTSAGKYLSWNGTYSLEASDSPAVTTVYCNEEGNYVFLQSANNEAHETRCINQSGGAGYLLFGGYMVNNKAHFVDNQFKLLKITDFIPADGLATTSSKEKAYYIVSPEGTDGSGIAVMGDPVPNNGNSAQSVLGGKAVTYTVNADGTVTVTDAVEEKISFWYFEAAETYGQYYIKDGKGQYMHFDHSHSMGLEIAGKKQSVAVYQKDGKYRMVVGADALNQYGGDGNALFGGFNDSANPSADSEFLLAEMSPSKELESHIATDLAYQSFYMVSPARDDCEAVAVKDQVSGNKYTGTRCVLRNNKMEPAQGVTLVRWTLIPTGDGEYYLRSEKGNYLFLSPDYITTDAVEKKSATRLKLHTNGVQYVLYAAGYTLNQSGGASSQNFGAFYKNLYTDVGNRYVLIEPEDASGLHPATLLDGATRAIVSPGSKGCYDLALTSSSASNHLTGILLQEDVAVQYGGNYWLDKTVTASTPDNSPAGVWEEKEIEEWTFTAADDGVPGHYYIQNAKGKYLCMKAAGDGKWYSSLSAAPVTLMVYEKKNKHSYDNGGEQKEGRADYMTYIICATATDGTYTNCTLDRLNGGTWLGGYGTQATDDLYENDAYVRFILPFVDHIGTVETTALNATVKLFNYDPEVNKIPLATEGKFKFTNGSSYVPAKDGVTSDEDVNMNPEMSPTLVDGYPAFTANGTQYSLSPLFSDDSPWKQAEMDNGGMLFQKDTKGYYSYYSAANAAWYDKARNQFVVYDTVVFPTHYPNYGAGNFLPFNPVTGSDIEHFSRNVREVKLDDGTTVSRNAFRLLGDEKNDLGVAELWFGMSIQFNFYIPEGGTLNNNDIVFKFRGDDDVWVFIDDYLVLDIGGIHAAAEGEINFKSGVVKYQKMKADNTLEWTNTTLNEIFEDENYMSKMPEHTMRIFYMERGGNISNAKFYFNLPVPNTVEVTKNITTSDGSDLKEEEKAAVDQLNFTYRVKDEDTGKYLTGYYYLYDSKGSYTTEYTSDGIFTLKNGQKAQFRVKTTAGSYTVEELAESLSESWVAPDYTTNANGDRSAGTATKTAQSTYPVTVTVKNPTSLGDSVSVVFTNKINKMEVMTPETLVIDYGLPVVAEIMDNDYSATQNKLNGGYTLTLDTTALQYGTVRVLNDANEAVTDYGTVAGHYRIEYTPYTYMSGEDVITYRYGDFQSSATLTIVPATSMYYEENFKNKYEENYISFTKPEQVTFEGTAYEPLQSTDYAGSKSVYGSDKEYLTDQTCKDSLGHSYHLDSTKGALSFSYTFTGTGTAFYSRISETSAYLRVRVYDDIAKKDVFSSTGGSSGYYRYIDTKYAVEDATLYHIPVFSINDLAYSTYTVTVTVAKPSLWYTGQPDLYLDGVRVFHPAGDSSAASAAYNADRESDVTFATLRSYLLSEQAEQEVYDLSDAVLKYGNATVTPSEDAIWSVTLTDNGKLYSAALKVIKDLSGGIYQVKATFQKDAAPVRAQLYYTTAEGTYFIWGSRKETEDGCVFTFTPAVETAITEVSLRAYVPDNSATATITLTHLDITSIRWDSDANILFTDSIAEIKNIGDYMNVGPKQEVYLNNGQTVAFALTDWMNAEAARLFLGMKTPNGEPATVTINGEAYTLNNTTECCYDITDAVVPLSGAAQHGQVVIRVTSGMVSLTTLKATCYPNFTLLSPNETVSYTEKGVPVSRSVHAMLASAMGAELPAMEETPDEGTTSALKIQSASLSTLSSISMNLYVSDETLQGCENAYMVITKEVYADDGTVTLVTQKITEFESRNNCHVYVLRGISAMEYSSKITATLYAVKDGVLVSSTPLEYSVVAYALRQLAKTDDARFKTLLVDMLNYGAAAQEYWGYHLSHLANADLTEEQRAFGTQTVPAMESRKSAVTGDGTVKLKSASLYLKDKVVMNFYVSTDAAVQELELVVTYTDAQGTVRRDTVDGSAFEQKDELYAVHYDALYATQMRTVCTVEIHSKTTGQCVSDTVTYSIESYAADMAPTDAALAAVLENMMKYGDAAEAFFLP